MKEELKEGKKKGNTGGLHKARGRRGIPGKMKDPHTQKGAFSRRFSPQSPKGQSHPGRGKKHDQGR